MLAENKYPKSQQAYFAEKAQLHGADAMALDLAYSGPPAEMGRARSNVEGTELLYRKLRMIIVANAAKEPRKVEFLRLAGVP